MPCMEDSEVERSCRRDYPPSCMHVLEDTHAHTHAQAYPPLHSQRHSHTLLTSESVDLVAARAGLVDITDEAREAADAVAAHLGLAAIAVIVQGKEGGSASLEVCPWRL